MLRMQRGECLERLLVVFMESVVDAGWKEMLRCGVVRTERNGIEGGGREGKWRWSRVWEQVTIIGRVGGTHRRRSSMAASDLIRFVYWQARAARAYLGMMHADRCSAAVRVFEISQDSAGR